MCTCVCVYVYVYVCVYMRACLCASVTWWQASRQSARAAVAVLSCPACTDYPRPGVRQTVIIALHRAISRPVHRPLSALIQHAQPGLNPIYNVYIYIHTHKYVLLRMQLKSGSVSGITGITAYMSILNSKYKKHHTLISSGIQT